MINSANNILPTGVSQVSINSKWECCKCGWVGMHSESSDKKPFVNDLYFLTCPKCGNKDEFYYAIDNIKTIEL